MKKSILFLSIFFAACGSTGVKEYHSAGADSAITIVLYITEDLTPKVDAVYRIVKDTFSFDTVNAETAKRVWEKDTAYYIPVQVPNLDSSGKTVVDSSGNIKKHLEFRLLRNNQMILQDYNKHF